MSDSNGSVVEGSIVRVEAAPMASELSVSVLMRRATDVAGVCREIVLRTAQSIPGSDRKHVKVEGWESIAAAYGYATGSGDVEPEMRDGKLVGFKAKGYLRRLSDGVVVAEAEGFTGEDEPIWAGGGLNKKTGKPHERRPEYARRAMAQTRAISRVCRGVFAFVVTLIDNKLSTTPAEEMDGVTIEGSIEPPAPVGVAGLKAKLGGPPPSPPKTQQPAHVPTEPPSHNRERIFRFGKDKDVPLHALSEGSLKFYQGAMQRDLASDDPQKQKYRDSNEAALADVNAELKYRGI